MEADDYQQNQKVKAARTLVTVYAKEIVKVWIGSSEAPALIRLKDALRTYDKEVDIRLKKK